MSGAPPAKVPVVEVSGRPLYSLQPRQLEAYKLTPVYAGRRGKQHVGYGGAAGGGKSYFARALACATACFWPGSTGIIFRRTEEEVLENHYTKFRTELPLSVIQDGIKVPFYSWNGRDLSFTFPLWKNSRILLGHLKHDDDVFKRGGNEYDWMVFEESTHYSQFQVQWLTGNRLRSTVAGTIPFAVYPSNPGSQGHFWYKRLFIDRNYREGENPDDYAFVQAFLKDNQELLLRDPTYEGKLNKMPEPWRSWVRDGNWSAGAGAALPQLNRRVHLIPPFEVPAHWMRFGAFDWGYAHPFSFGEYAVSEDGDVFKLQTITGRHLLPHEIAQRITSKLRDPHGLSYIVAGHDISNKIKARGENTPTLQEQFMEYGLYMTLANIDRPQGLNNLRGYLAWENIGPGASVGDPGLRLFDNPGNRRALEQLELMVTDPDDVEDVLKVDADDYGEGGDDIYDETRYGVASRPSKAPSLYTRGNVSAFSPESLAADVKRLYKRDDKRNPKDIGVRHYDAEGL